MSKSFDRHSLEPSRQPQQLIEDTHFQDFIYICYNLEAQLANPHCSNILLKSLIKKISAIMGKTPQMILKSEPNQSNSRIIQLILSKIKQGNDCDLMMPLLKLLKLQFGNDKAWDKRVLFKNFAGLLKHPNIRVVQIGVYGISFTLSSLSYIVPDQSLMLRQFEYFLFCSDNPAILLHSVKILSHCLNLQPRESAGPCFRALLKFFVAKKQMNQQPNYFYAHIQALLEIKIFFSRARHLEIQLVIDSGVLGPLIQQAMLPTKLPYFANYIFELVLKLLQNGLQSQKKAICCSVFIDQLLHFGLHSLCSGVRLNSFKILAKFAESPKTIEIIFSKQLVSRLLFMFKSNNHSQSELRLLSGVLYNGSSAYLTEFASFYGREIIEYLSEEYATTTCPSRQRAAVQTIAHMFKVGFNCNRNETIGVFNKKLMEMPKKTAQSLSQRVIKQYNIYFGSRWSMIA